MAPKTPEELISALVDDELGTEERARAEQLLAQRPELRAQYDELRALRASFESLPRHTAPAALRASVLERIEALRRSEAAASSDGASLAGTTSEAGLSDQAAPTPTLLRFPRGLRPWLWPAVALAAAVVIMVVGREPKPQIQLADTRADRAEKTANRDGRIGAAPKAPSATNVWGETPRVQDETSSAPATGASDSGTLKSADDDSVEREAFEKKGEAANKAEPADRIPFNALRGARRSGEALPGAPSRAEAPDLNGRPVDALGGNLGGNRRPAEPGSTRQRAEASEGANRAKAPDDAGGSAKGPTRGRRPSDAPDLETHFLNKLNKLPDNAPVDASEPGRVAKEGAAIQGKSAANGAIRGGGAGAGFGNGHSKRAAEPLGETIRNFGKGQEEQFEERDLSKTAATGGRRRASGPAAQDLVVRCDITATALDNEALPNILSKRNIAYSRTLRESLNNFKQLPSGGQKRGPTHVDFYFEASPQQVEDALSDIRNSVTEFPVVEVKAAPDVPQQELFSRFSRNNYGFHAGDNSSGPLPAAAQARTEAAGPGVTAEIDRAGARYQDAKHAQDGLPRDEALHGTAGRGNKIAKKERQTVEEKAKKPPPLSAHQPLTGSVQQPPPAQTLTRPPAQSSPAPLAKSPPAQVQAPLALPAPAQPSLKPDTRLGVAADKENESSRDGQKLDEELNADPKAAMEDLLAGTPQKNLQQANKLRVLLRLRMADPRQQVIRNKKG